MKIDYRSTDKVLIVDISGIPSDLFLKEAKVHLILKVLVKDSRPVNSSRIISSKEFTIDSNSHSIHINIEEPFYYYSGEKIQIVPEIKVIINDSIFFDTKISKKVTKELSRPPKVSENPKKVLNPKDTFEWLYNISCISHRDKVIVAVLMIV